MTEQSSFSTEVIEKLQQPLDSDLVSYRKGNQGRELAYIAGYTAIEQANRIFGYDAWGYELVGPVYPQSVQSVNSRTGEVSTSTLYMASIRVDVRGAPSRTDIGCHPLVGDTLDSHDIAIKAAVTDALKRALRSFGDQFGNALYGEDTKSTPKQPPRDAPEGWVMPFVNQVKNTYDLTTTQVLEDLGVSRGREIAEQYTEQEARARIEMLHGINSQAEGPAPASPSKNLSPKQIQRLWAIANSNGYDKASIEQLIHSQVEKTEDLPWARYDELCKWMQDREDLAQMEYRWGLNNEDNEQAQPTSADSAGADS